MAGSMVQNCGFRESCKTFYRMKGVVQPTCGCGACWSFYFFKNPTKVAAARLALKQFGPDAVILAQGKDFAAALEQRETFEIRAGVIKHRSDYVEAAKRRGTKYLRHVLRFLKEELPSKFTHGDSSDEEMYQEDAVAA